MGRKLCPSPKAWLLPGPWVGTCWSCAAPGLRSRPGVPRRRPSPLLSAPSSSQCLEKFPVIQHFKFGSLLPIHPVTSC